MQSLADAKIGWVYNFDYNQPMSGETHRHLAKVVAVRKLTEEDIRRISSESKYRKWDCDFERTETIVTCRMSDGNHRNFYAERTENCTLSLMATLFFWLGAAGLVFRRKPS